MEPKFQQTFIPKRSVVTATPAQASQEQHRAIGIVPLISWGIFFLTIVLAVGLFVYGILIQRNINSINDKLVSVEGSFDQTLVNNLKAVDNRLKLGQKLINNHIAVSAIFPLLASDTLKTVRYTDFKYSNSDGKPVIALSGQALNYNALALQADIINGDSNFIKPEFSGVRRDKDNNVIFALQSVINDNVLSFAALTKGNGGSTTTAIPEIPAGTDQTASTTQASSAQ